MDPTKDFKGFQDQVTSKLVQTTRTTGQLASEDLKFLRSWNRELSDALDEEGKRILSVTSSLLKTSSSTRAAPVLQDEESVEDNNWRGVVDVIDALLEKADACLDEFTGVIKRLSPSQEARFAGRKVRPKFPTVYDYGPSKIPKPQAEFLRPVDNTDGIHFRPVLRAKPHAIVPLDKSLVMTAEEDGSYRNPYEAEIRAVDKYPPWAYDESPPVPFLPFESTTATFVDTMEGVRDMLSELQSAKEIAIDVEHHDLHSYQGIVSLMQISTRSKDWLIDTLKPWREELQILNHVFADPRIVKVLHGASMDIIWLQRDLGLYVVGMFDTFFAADVLNYQKRSLKFLLHKFADFEADKAYQMADWRVRPLPQEMFDYARSDTHYLLNIYDHLRNELVENSGAGNNLIDHVLEQSKRVALQRYEPPRYNAETGQGKGGWYEYLMRSGSALSKEQLAVFRAVHQWRDRVAREEDEGVQCVFPKHVLFKLANTMPLDMGVLLKTMSPMTPMARNRASDLLRVIKQAKIDSAMGPEWNEIIKAHKPPSPPPAEEEDDDGEDDDVDLARDHPDAERSSESQFWGSLLDYREPVPPLENSIIASQEALRLSLPLLRMPSIVAEVRPAKKTSPPPPPQPKLKAPARTTSIFTVKQASSTANKRKMPEEEEEVTAGGDKVAKEHVDLTDEAAALKREQKRARKKAKREKREQQQQENEKKKDEEAPFDYSRAESMLNASGPEPSTEVRPFNPYAKAMDAPKGLRKNKVELGSKTFTFRK